MASHLKAHLSRSITATDMRGFTAFLFAAMASLAWTVPVLSKPSISTNTTYYEVSGQTGAELRRQMGALGPEGYWAYTEWWVEWSRSCQLSVTIDYTMPKLADRNTLPAGLLQKWDIMIAALIAHEEQHGQHGIEAAMEIERKGCNGAYQIIRFWNNQDILFDRETDHGAHQGVTLD